MISKQFQQTKTDDKKKNAILLLTLSKVLCRVRNIIIVSFLKYIMVFTATIRPELIKRGPTSHICVRLENTPSFSSNAKMVITVPTENNKIDSVK